MVTNVLRDASGRAIGRPLAKLENLSDPVAMPRALTRTQLLQNRAFLAALRGTGNVREAARATGLHRAMLTKRRAAHPAFAAQWDAALAVAHAALNRDRGGDDAAGHLVRTATGRLQLRRTPPGGMTRAAEQRFLAALSATANVRLAAAAAGFAHSSFYARARANPVFAREMRLATQMGYDNVECALIAGYDPEAAGTEAWRHNDLPPVPPMSPGQAIQALMLHHKTARLWAERPDQKRRRGESSDTHATRLALKWTAEKMREAQDRAVAASAQAAGDRRSRWEPDAPALPALEQVKGWSKAGQGAVHDPDVALFGGWRLGDWQRRER